MSYSFEEIAEDIEASAQRSIVATLEGKQYSQKNVVSWTDELNELILKHACKLSDNLKYVVSTVIIQNKNEEEKSNTSTAASEITMSSAALCNATTDGAVTVKWDNKTLSVVVTVYGILI